MDLFSTDFLLALGAIVVIDLLLAGDNAIVIALAARKLPADLQRRAVLWGTVCAVALRTVLTLAVVWLLKLPGLMLAGGIMLVWIAYQLLLPEEANGEGTAVNPAPNFWAALRTIVVADVVMGLDNVLAVAGAAHGSFLLVALGLLISVPIMVYGSTLLLRYVERFPALIYFGAGVLAWTAAKMIVAEPLVKEWLAPGAQGSALLQVTLVSGVLFAGLMHNHRRLESRIAARATRLSTALATPPAAIHPAEGVPPMMKILLPVDGSPNALHAVRQVIREAARNRDLTVHLLNVQTPLSQAVGQFIPRRTRAEWHRERAAEALAPAQALLESAGVPHCVHFELGRRAETIVRTAQRLGCDHIVMGTARKSSLTRMVEASVTNRVLELTEIPVEVVAGESVSRLERFGIPIGLGSALALLVLAAAD